jgi:hypothetical protein
VARGPAAHAAKVLSPDLYCDVLMKEYPCDPVVNVTTHIVSGSQEYTQHALQVSPVSATINTRGIIPIGLIT